MGDAGGAVDNKNAEVYYIPQHFLCLIVLRQTESEQNRCAMAFQGYGAVFTFF